VARLNWHIPYSTDIDDSDHDDHVWASILDLAQTDANDDEMNALSFGHQLVLLKIMPE
jgi:hypothetical protein